MATSDEGTTRPSVEMANYIIDLANSWLSEGMSGDEIASGLRHAAANFSAFQFFREDPSQADPNRVVDEFVAYFQHYLDLHGPDEPPAGGLFQVIEQAKNEV